MHVSLLWKIYTGADIVGDLSAEGSVVHKEDIQIFSVVNNEFFKSVRKIVLGGFVWSVSYFGHFLITSESSSHSVINAYMFVKLPLGLLQLSASLPP